MYMYIYIIVQLYNEVGPLLPSHNMLPNHLVITYTTVYGLVDGICGIGVHHSIHHVLI